jgi:hypothetical protein
MKRVLLARPGSFRCAHEVCAPGIQKRALCGPLHFGARVRNGAEGNQPRREAVP